MSIHRLKARDVEKETRAGMYADGGGLYLQVGEGGTAKSWIFRYSRRRFGKLSEAHMGLGATHTFSLDEARELARECRQQIARGIDPLEERKTAQGAKKAEESKEESKDVSFAFCAQDYLEYKRKILSADSIRNIKSLIDVRLNPAFGKLPVTAISHLVIERVLLPIYDQTPAQGEFARMQLKAILERAKAKGFRTGDNPASLEGPLGILLGQIIERHVSQAHKALPYQEIGSFMSQLRAIRTSDGKRSVPALALEFIILTGVRVSEATGMQWREINADEKLWTCPWIRTKTGKKTKRDHLVTLSDDAMAVLMEARKTEVRSEFVFASQRTWFNGKKPHLAGTPIERHAPTIILRNNLKQREITVHGFRSTFSTWANDKNFPREAIEIALDHFIGTDVERSYNRAERFKQRYQLMDAWAQFCARTEPLAGDVIEFRQAK